MTRTLVISEVFPPRVGGSGRWLWDVYSQLPRGGFVIAAGQADGDAAFDQTHDLEVRRLPLSLHSWGVLGWQAGRDYWRVFRQLQAIVRAKHIHEVHAGRCLPEGLLAWLLHQRYGTKYFVFAHGEEFNNIGNSRELCWLARRVLRDASRIVANSDNTANVLKRDWRVAADRIRVLHPGIDVDHFSPAPRNDDIRRQLGWHDRRVILTVGRLQPRKGQEQIIRVIPEIRKSVPDVLYAIIGDGEDRPALCRLVTELGLNEFVILHGELTGEDVLRAYQQCDLFALPNLNYHGDFEGFGIVLLEAQACGKSAIAGDSGGTAETMDVPASGRVVRADVPSELTATLIELLADESLRERMGRAGRDWVVANFDRRAQAHEAQQIFSEDNVNKRCHAPATVAVHA